MDSCFYSLSSARSFRNDAGSNYVLQRTPTPPAWSPLNTALGAMESECAHYLPSWKRVFAFRGAGVRCAICNAHVSIPHPLSSGISGGLGAFMFIPFVALLFVIGSGWWLALALILISLVSIYVYEAYSKKLCQYDHSSEVRRSNKNLLVLAVFLLLGAIANAVT